MNLLNDPVFTVRTFDGPEKCSLPRIYRLLWTDQVEGFAKLQAHQKQAWHCFLAQLGAIATEDREMPDSGDGWREALSALTCREAWNLYTEDLSKPAFMQPPVPEETLEQFSEIHPTEYDALTLSKNHALKIRRMQSSEPEHWVYLLVNVQTTGYYSGGGRRTSRMNGGYGSRPFFGITPSLRLGQWIRRDIRVLKDHISEIESHLSFNFSRNVSPLLWTVPWEGNDSLELSELHPLYIDCARRIRRGEKNWQKSDTGTERVTGDIGGQTGDPWAPVNEAEGKVLNPSPADFGYRNLREILLGGDYRRPISFKQPTDGYIVCRGIFTNPDKQGGTRDHYRERVIRFSNTESDNPFENTEESQVAEEAEYRVEKAGQAESILSHALDYMLRDDITEGDIPGTSKDGKKTGLKAVKQNQINALNARIDQRFFEKLFRASEMSDKARSQFWETALVGALRAQWEDAKSFCPAKDQWHRLARAKSTLDRRIKYTFTHAKQTAKFNEHTKAEEEKEESNARPVADL
jgi:CRISPR system Cascade subunit CasA